jgi:hypothetical protein
MKVIFCRSLALAIFVASSWAVCAEAQAPAVGMQVEADGGQSFVAQQRASRRDFRQKQDQDGKAFRDSIKGKSPDEQKTLREQFRARQKAERAAFNKDQKERRRAFRAAHPSPGGHHHRRPADPPQGQ